jgi:hypothetical protein
MAVFVFYTIFYDNKPNGPPAATSTWLSVTFDSLKNAPFIQLLKNERAVLADYWLPTLSQSLVYALTAFPLIKKFSEIRHKCWTYALSSTTLNNQCL